MRFLAGLLLLVGAVSAVPSYTRTQAPRGWTLGERADTAAKVSFTVALTQQNLDQLDAKFIAVSTPGSPEYRNFMTPDEILDIVAPPQSDKDLVTAWLMSHGVKSYIDLGDALEVSTTVSVAQNLFNTFFHQYTSTDNNKSIIRSFGTYSIDDRVADKIHMIAGISSFPIPHYKTQKSRRHHTSNIAGGDQGIIAQSLEALYDVPTKLGLSTNTSQGVIEFQSENFNPADLVAYGKLVSLSPPPVSKAHTVGPNVPSEPQIEASLDVDMIATINTEADNWFWLEDGDNWLYQYATHFFSTASVPQVVSISYGWSESDQCTINPTECSSIGVDSNQYVQRVNTEFQKIGLRGVSLFSASGDSGANGRTDDECTGKQLFPDFPGSSPYVTAVGATEIASPVFALKSPPPICSSSGYQCVSGGLEQAVSYAVSSFASGGGFSNVAPTPTYQKTAVAAYLSSGVALPPSSYFNKTSRGYPDVAAVGHNNLIYQDGVQAVGGTSASSPIWAGVAALLNQAAIAKDGKPLGFLNPLLYSIAQSDPSAFHDITVGDNICTEGGCSAGCKGFKATKGWDPVTGLGSPNFPALLKAVQAQL